MAQAVFFGKTDLFFAVGLDRHLADQAIAPIRDIDETGWIDGHSIGLLEQGMRWPGHCRRRAPVAICAGHGRDIAVARHLPHHIAVMVELREVEVASAIEGDVFLVLPWLLVVAMVFGIRNRFNSMAPLWGTTPIP